MADDNIKRPCEGIRVIEFCTMVSGPFAGQMLADLGAEVIKVEAIGGDPMRFVRPEHKGIGALFLHVNRNKKSIGLNLKSSEAIGIARALAANADVVIENFRPGVMDRLGLGYESLKAENPGLIFVSISGFGTSGPYADRAAYDHVIQGLTGIMRVAGTAGKPVPVRNIIVDKTASMSATNAILAALLQRERAGGGGQRISVSLLDSFAAFSLPEMIVNHTFLEPGADTRPPVDIYHPLETSDGYVIGHIQLDAQFAAACRIFGREELIEDPRYCTMAERAMHFEQMWSEFAAPARTMTTGAIIEAANEHSLPMAPINTVEEFLEDPQGQHSRAHFVHQDPELGPIRLLGYPATLEGSPARVEARAPFLAEHTVELLHELGIDDATIATYKAAGAVQ